MGDRLGLAILTRIVVWWSVFTAVTGFGLEFSHLLNPFCSALAEAGAYPNSSSSISRWFPGRSVPGDGVSGWPAVLGGAIAPGWLSLQQAYAAGVFFFLGIMGCLGAHLVAW